MVADLGVGAAAAGVRALAVGDGASVEGVGAPAEEQNCGAPLAGGRAEDAAGPLVGEVPAVLTDSSAPRGFEVDPPVADTPSPDEDIAAVARSYAFLDPEQRHAMSGIVDLHLLTVGMCEIALTQPPGTCDEIWDFWLGLLAATGTVACRSRPVAVAEAPGARAWRLTRAEGRQQTVRDRCRGVSGEWRRGERVNSAPRPPR